MVTDVFVVGGGPAGLAAAIAARLRGFRVTLIDPRTPPLDKPCGEGLLPEGVAAFRELGVDPASAVGHSFLGLEFLDAGSNARATFTNGQAWGMRRTLLHSALTDRAAQLGVQLRWGTRIESWTSTEVRAGCERITFRWLIAADGQDSAIRKGLGIGWKHLTRPRFGFRRHYRVAPWTEFVEVHWAKHSQIVVNPTAADEVCVSFFTSNRTTRIEGALELFPRLRERLDSSASISADRGGLVACRRAAAVYRDNVALVGDASGTLDGIAGQGVSLAFRQALALADALACNHLPSYESAHREMFREPLRATKLLLLLSAAPALRTRVLKLFSARPKLFEEMVKAHTGSACAPLRVRAIANVGWQALWA